MTIPQMHMDDQRSEEDRVEMHQSAGFRQEILPQLSKHRRKPAAPSNYESDYGYRT